MEHRGLARPDGALPQGPRRVVFAYRRQGTRLLGCADIPRGGSYMVRVSRTKFVETREGYRVRVNLPRPEHATAEVFHVNSGTARLEMSPDELRKVLVTIEHEVDHTMGLRHKDMLDDATRACAWADDPKALVGIRLEPPAARDAGSERAAKIIEHERAIAKMRTRIKRAETAIATRERKIRGLEQADRRQAARREP